MHLDDITLGQTVGLLLDGTREHPGMKAVERILFTAFENYGFIF